MQGITKTQHYFFIAYLGKSGQVGLF